jgi:ribonuclease HII
MKGKSLHPRSDSGLTPESDLVIFGMDEVGAGCLAGPVVAGCFAYHTSASWCANDNLPVRVFDSKKLSEIRRQQSAAFLCDENLGLAAHSIVEVSPERIDEINILWARMEAMWLAFVEAHAKMSAKLGEDKFVWRAFVDGNRFPRQVETWGAFAPFDCAEFKSRMPTLPFKTVIQGDSHVFAIAAASIIAKEFRDNLMFELGELPKYQPYCWGKNVGYPTPEHKAAIAQVGLSDLHRKTFSTQS